MIETVREVWIDAPAERIWPLVDDPARLPEWFSFAERAELLEGEGAGRRQRIYGHWGKRPSEVDQRVIEHEPGRRLVWTHEAERLNGKPAPRFARETRFEIDLVPEGEGTRVRLRSAQEPAGFLRGVVLRAFGGREVAGQMDRSLERLVGAVR